MSVDYNIPRKIRELQSRFQRMVSINYYNIPRKIRELQFVDVKGQTNYIITYQEKLGNYNMTIKRIRKR